MFDEKCLQHKVYKVYTIGDCYVVLGHTDKEDRSPLKEAYNTVCMGFSMIEIIEELKKKLQIKTLAMRIGIHTVILVIH